MIGSRRIAVFASAAVPLVALVVAGCGSGGSTSSSAPQPLRTADGSSATINGATTGLGATLVNSQGHTIYLFRKDTGTKSACFGACASAWPPVRTSGKPTVGGGAKASLVGTTKRSDGKPQVTYDGHPLYLFQGDKKPGDTNGQGITAFGAAWFGVSPTGKQVSGQAPSSAGGTSSSSGGLGY
jgi:predicted lipoprotein with Yx(FWY)xxD motif